MAAKTKTSKIRLGILMWLLGMLGVVSIVLLLPSLLAGHPLPIPMWQLSLIQTLQGGILVAISVYIGVSLAPKVGLHSPALENVVVSRPFLAPLQPQLLPSLIGGITVGLILIFASYVTPQELIVASLNLSLKRIMAEILYGGITEEIMMRWGIMTLLLWLFWRFIQRNQNSPSPSLIWTAIIVSSLFFAIGHLPAALSLVGHLTPHIITYVIMANTFSGIVFGLLYQRIGLESAMLAHVLAHIINDLMRS